MKIQNINLFPFMVVLAVLMLVACAPSEGATPTGFQTQPVGDDSRLIDATWRLDSFGPVSAPTEVIGETDLTLAFDGNVKAGGFGGCNTFGAEYQVVDDDQLFIDEIIATEIACEAAGIMEQEIAYFDALRSAERFEVSDDQLTIWYNDGQGALNFSRLVGNTPVPATPSPES